MNPLLRYHAAFVALVLLAWSPTVQAQTEWTHYSTEAVLDADTGQEWSEAGVISPTVLRAEGDTLKMWYAGGDGINVETGTITHTQIGYAWSLDGVSWTRHPDNPVLTCTEFACPHLMVPRVLADGDTLRMWYAWGDFNVPYLFIGYATSTDGGVTWEVHNADFNRGPANTWNADAVIPGDVIKEDGVFKMWFTGGIGPLVPTNSSTRYSIGYATSPDGVTWTLYDDPTTTEAPFHLSDPVLKHGISDSEFDRREASAASVQRTDSGYDLWYHGNRDVPSSAAIGYATSPDGIHWTKHEGNPVLTVAGAPLAQELFHPSVLLYDGQYHMWLSLFGNDDPPVYSNIGYATAPVTPVANEPGAASSEAVVLGAPFPNPTTDGATLAYRLNQPVHVTLTVYDLLGREVARLVDGARPAGEHTAVWDGTDGSGGRLGTGVYVVRLQAGDAMQSRNVVLLR